MAHFAELDEQNKVLRVLVVSNEVTTIDGEESEQRGIDSLVDLLGDKIWKQTSYNHTFRKNYAGKGYTYDETRDAFISPKAFPSWSLDEDTCLWKAPTPKPDDDKRYYWDEETTSWKENE